MTITAARRAEGAPIEGPPERGPGAGPAAPAWITEGSVARAAWRLSLPLVVGAILQDVFALADLFFVSWLGAAAVGAMGICAALMGVAHMVAMGITTGCTALVSQAAGARNRRQTERVAAQSVVLALVLSAAVTVPGVLFAGALLRLMGASEAVADFGAPYLAITAGGSVVIFLTAGLMAVLRGVGDAVSPLRIIGVSNLLNIALDPLLIFGLPGMPGLGMAGAALATVVSRLLGVFLLLRLLLGARHAHVRVHVADLRPDRRIISPMLRVGVFSSGQVLVRNVSSLALMRLVASFGEISLAAYAIGTRLRNVVMMPGLGFGNAAATLVGQNLGAGSPRRAASAAWHTVGMYVAVTLVLTAVAWGFAEPIVGAFNRRGDAEVVVQGATFLRWFSSSFAFMALSGILGRAMQGAGDTFWPMMISAVTLLAVRIGAAHGLAWALGSVTGVWIALTLSNVVQGLLFVAAFQWGRWKRIGAALVETAKA